MQRLKTRAQFEAAMAGGTVSRTPHFVLHRAALPAPSAAPSEAPASTTGATGAGAVSEAGRSAVRAKVLFPPGEEPWVGAVLPKRWAKRAVTRNGIRRQIYNVSASFEPRLPASAHVVRLRMEFARKDFPSAWSEALKAAVRGELQQLFEKVAKAVVPVPQSATSAPHPVIPAKAGIQEGP